MIELEKVSVQPSEENPSEGSCRDWSVFRQHLAAILANLAALNVGLCLGWTSPALPLLQREVPDVDLPLYLTPEEGSWTSCLLPLGAAVGSLPAGLLSDWIGRKKAILSLAIPYLVGWLLILFADTSVPQVYVGRIIAGLSIGGTTVLVPQYTEEISEPAIRGALGVYLDLSICNGIFLSNLLGCFLSYTWFTTVSCVAPVIFVSTFIWMPESPVCLLHEDRVEDATKSLSWLRKGKTVQDIQREIQCIREHLRKQQEEKDDRPAMIRVKAFFSNFTSQNTFLKTMAIVLGLMFFQEVGGVNAITFYTVSIFNSSGSTMSGNESSSIVGACICVSDFCSSLYVDRLGRRPMLLISASVTTLCMATLSIYFHYSVNGYDMESWKWVPLASLIIFMIGFTSGFSPLPWLLMAELVPTKHQTWFTPVSCCINWAFVALIAKEFPDMRAHLGDDVSYGIFSAVCVASFIFVWFCVPETKGKSREEIQELLNSKVNGSFPPGRPENQVP